MNFKTLVHGNEPIDVNELDHGIYGSKKPFLYDSRETIESIVARHEEVSGFIGDAGKDMVAFKSNINKCQLKECVLIINS